MNGGRTCPRAVAFVSASLFLLAGGATFAQTPTVSKISPQAVAPGKAADVTISGGALDGATELWTSFPASAVLSPDVKENGKNAGQVVFRITVPADVPPGIHGLRVTTGRGVSPMRLIVVDDLPSVVHQNKNKTVATAQELTPPVAVDGHVDSLSRNYFRFKAAAGQKLSFEVLARRIGSTLDPMIRILDATGRELTYSDDEPGLSSDARLEYTFKNAGDYTLEIRDIRYQGGGNHFYRLRVGDFPCVTTPWPMAGKRGQKVAVGFAGGDVAGLQPIEITVPSDPNVEWMTVAAKRPGGNSSGFATIAVENADQAVETEPNDEVKTATRIALGAGLNGRFEKPGDIDHFVVPAKKGQKFTFKAITRSQGSPVDMYLRILNAQGGQVAVSEDNGTADASITYTFPADGDYLVSAEDLHRRGGPKFAYRIEAAEFKPTYKLTASADALNIPTGGTIAVTVNAARDGYGGPIRVEAVGLPEGVTSVPTVIGPGRGDAVLTLTSKPDAPVAKLFPVQIVGKAKIGEVDYAATATVETSLKAALANMPFPPRVLEESAAVAIAPKPNFTLRVEPQQIVFGKDLNATVKVVAVREKDFNEPITLAVTPPKNGLPPGITAAVKPIPQGQNEVAIVISANNAAPLGEFTAALTGTLKKGNATHTQPAPGVGLKLEQPFTLSGEPGENAVAKGGNVKFNVKIQRNPAFNAPVTLAFQNLPKGVTIPAATIPADKDAVEVTANAAADAAVGAVPLSVKGDATIGKAKFSVTTNAGKLTVQ